MLSLEQIKRLENKVYKAVELLKAFKEDNTILKSELKSANERVEELEQIISDYRNNQLEIEEGIIKAIKQLDDIDSITDETEDNGTTSVETELNMDKSETAVEVDQNSAAIIASETESEPEKDSQQLDIF